MNRSKYLEPKPDTKEISLKEAEAFALKVSEKMYKEDEDMSDRKAADPDVSNAPYRMNGYFPAVEFNRQTLPIIHITMEQLRAGAIISVDGRNFHISRIDQTSSHGQPDTLNITAISGRIGGRR